LLSFLYLFSILFLPFSYHPPIFVVYALGVERDKGLFYKAFLS